MSEIPEDVINSMCLTWRHDFGLRLEPSDVLFGTEPGMTEPQREALRRDMRQLYEHHIRPAILAERESCAKVADEQASREEYGHAKHACVTIAQAIREGSS